MGLDLKHAEELYSQLMLSALTRDFTQMPTVETRKERLQKAYDFMLSAEAVGQEGADFLMRNLPYAKPLFCEDREDFYKLTKIYLLLAQHASGEVLSELKVHETLYLDHCLSQLPSEKEGAQKENKRPRKQAIRKAAA